MFDVKHFLLSHLIWVIGVIVGIIGFYSWLGQHDARLQAEQAAKVADANVKNLQAQIADRDKQAAAQVAPIIKIIHDVQTVPQAIVALPKVIDLPVPVVAAPNNAVLIPEPDVLPLFAQVADDKVCRVLLTAANVDLVDTKAIVVQRDMEIKALKKPKTFWHKVGGAIKVVAISVGVGFALGKKF